ncbi:hypothetical protein CSV86_009300 [Pseudomonas putida CSV86]|uniref:Uncharacterized protein n=1 Tax=Pseudomonas bharatica CSV86 TaxID=1005395 RepID=A0A7K4ECM9_9PSED|nr:hypothetical protein [Pseudomonas bharatica]NNJ15413.1 hypothetical protein [Pseudomonas bharatica CSV86]
MGEQVQALEQVLCHRPEALAGRGLQQFRRALLLLQQQPRADCCSGSSSPAGGVLADQQSVLGDRKKPFKNNELMSWHERCNSPGKGHPARSIP